MARAADGLSWSPLEVALAWVRDRPGVTAPIVGARTAAQLRGSLTVEECDAARGDRRGAGRRSSGDGRWNPQTPEAHVPCGRWPAVSRCSHVSSTRPRRREADGVGPASGVRVRAADRSPGSFSRSFVTRLLIDRAEHGGWELDRLRLFPDGTRRVVLRRKIIRQRADVAAF